MKTIGQMYEETAAVWLRRKGYEIIQRNYSTRWGEIDIIAERKGVVHFIEVKGRKQGAWFHPEETVNKSKIRRIYQTALMYTSTDKKNRDFSIDVIAITQGALEPTIEFFENIMEE